MKFRLQAFGLHLSGSAIALTLVLGAFWLGWYRWPGWYLAGVLHVAGILVLVDLVLGPTLTLIVANPGKPRRHHGTPSLPEAAPPVEVSIDRVSSATRSRTIACCCDSRGRSVSADVHRVRAFGRSPARTAASASAASCFSCSE